MVAAPIISMGDIVRDGRPDHDGQTGVVLDHALLTVEITEQSVTAALAAEIEACRVVEIFSVCWGLDTLMGVKNARAEMMQADEIELVTKHKDVR